MAPGLNGRQTGTVPKNKPKNSGSQSHRLPRESLIRSTWSNWDPMPDLGNRNSGKKKGSMTHSETEVDAIRHDLARSRSSTMTSQIENGEGSSQDGVSGRLNIPDRKQVVNKLSQIQSYIQQTAALMNALKTSESPAQKTQYEKLLVMLEDLRDSEAKLSNLLNKMDSTESRIDNLLTDLEQHQASNTEGDSRRMKKFNQLVNDNYGSTECVSNMGNNNSEADEEELVRRSEESKKKLEVLQKRKEDLLKLQEKAKRQLQDAQAEQTRLVARASSLNQELNANKAIDLNVQQLSQRLKAVQQMYNARTQISEGLANSRRPNEEAEHIEEDQAEMSDTETDFQLVADKVEELNAMKAQLGHIQKIMASINGIQINEVPSTPRGSGEDAKDQTNHNSQNSSFTDGEQNGEDMNNNGMKLEQAKTKLSHLTQLLELVQSAQNTTGLSPSYLQMVSNMVNEEAGSSTPSPSPEESVKSPIKNSEETAMETMQVMTRELEETTAAMKEERDRLLQARQELQDIARRLPLNKPDIESISPDDYSESEPPMLKPAVMDSNNREMLNGSIITEAEQSSNGNDGSLYVCRSVPARNRQRGTWNSSAPGSNSTTQDRRFKNDSLSRGSNQSSRGGSRALGRDQARWSPSPSSSYCNERPNQALQTQNQLEVCSNLCEMMLSDSLQRGIRPGDISLQEMFNQHQLLTRTVAQCSQLLWFQQKQIIELRNAFMLQCGTSSNFQQQQTLPSNQSLLPPLANPSFPGPSFSNSQVPPSLFQQQNFHPMNQKSNSGEMQNAQLHHQDFPESFMHQSNQSTMHFTPEVFGCDMRPGNFTRYNPPNSNANQNINLNVSSGSNNRVPGGPCVGPEDSRALNNQVPPGNRANNYWDNFRSYSRQNLLSTTKSNEDTESSRRSHAASGQERPPRDGLLQPSLQNNQSTTGSSQQVVNQNSEPGPSDQYLLPTSQNTRVNHHSQVIRSRSVEPQNHRNPGKNESRHQDNVAGKNEGCGGARSRNPDCGPENIRSVRNDVSQNSRNVDNLNNSRNFVQMVRDFDNEEVPQGNNKKRLERTRCRNEGLGNLNNRGYHNSSLWENISSEVTNFIRVNEARPQFLLQLFRDLQQVTTDSLRQRTLELIQEAIRANNLTERSSNPNGGNVNIIDNRNNIRENRSNLNRNQTDDPTNIDELFYHLRENQNTIRQNIGMSSLILGGNNLENPNISNIRDLGSRNNLENEGLRDLRTYFEANLCNFGHNSTLENPNLSNIRENLTRRVSGLSDLENTNPKNVYLSIFDNATVDRRRNQESVQPDFGAPFRNFESNGFANEVLESGPVRVSNNQYEMGSNFEGAVGGRAHFQQDRHDSRFSILDAGDNFGRSRQFLTNGNDSGIDINFNNDERKRNFLEGDSVTTDRTSKVKKNEPTSDSEGAAALILPQWERNSSRDTSFDSSVRISRNDMSSPFLPICDNSFFTCRTFQQLDNGDLAEADQSRNEETSGAESDSGFMKPLVVDSDFMKAQIVEPESGYDPDTNLQSSVNDFANQNIPESERSFLESQNEIDIDWGGGTEPEGNIGFPSSASEPEGNFTRMTETSENHQKSEGAEGFYYQMNAGSSSDGAASKSGVKNRKKVEEAERESSGEMKKSSCKNSTNKYRDSSFSQANFNGGEEYGGNSKTDSDSATSVIVIKERQRTESGDSLCYGAFQVIMDKNTEGEKENASPEAESDWECGSGLDQVPTKLTKSGSDSDSGA